MSEVPVNFDDLVSIREYSRMREVSDTTVREWIKVGKILESAINYDNPKRPLIHVGKADSQYKAFMDRLKAQMKAAALLPVEKLPRNPVGRPKKDAIPKLVKEPKPVKEKSVKPINPDVLRVNSSPITIPTFPKQYGAPVNAGIDDDDDGEIPAPVTNGRARSSAQVKLLIDEIKLQKEAIGLRKLKGELVDVQDVRKALYEIAKDLRIELLNIPDRIIDDVMAADTRNQAHTLLSEELAQAIERFVEAQGRSLLLA